jgi:hypothetical protein
MDTRAWRLPLPPGTSWFELDQADLTAAKVAALDALGAQQAAPGQPGRPGVAGQLWGLVRQARWLAALRWAGLVAWWKKDAVLQQVVDHLNDRVSGWGGHSSVQQSGRMFLLPVRSWQHLRGTGWVEQHCVALCCSTSSGAAVAQCSKLVPQCTHVAVHLRRQHTHRFTLTVHTFLLWRLLCCRWRRCCRCWVDTAPA